MMSKSMSVKEFQECYGTRAIIFVVEGVDWKREESAVREEFVMKRFTEVDH